MKPKKLLLIAVALSIAFAVLAVSPPLLPTVKAAGEDWLIGWGYRKSHVINGASGAGTDYPIRVKANYGSGTDSGENVYLAGKCRSDFGDIRFTDDDGPTLLDYWLEEKVDGNYAIFRVEVKDNLSSGSALIYVYYGNSNATRGDQPQRMDVWSLREHGSGPVITFSKPSASVLRIESTSSSVGQGLVFIIVPKSYLHGKKVRVYWNVYYTYADSRDLMLGRVLVLDAEIRRSQTFPSTNPIENLYPNIAATHYPGPLGRSGWLGWRTDTSGALNLSNFTNSYVTLMIRLSDSWGGQAVSVDVDYLQILDANDNVLEEYHFDKSVVMERTGTTADYGLYRKYVSPEPSHGSWGQEERAPTGGGPYPPTLTSPANNTRFNPGASVVFSWTFVHWNNSESQSAYQFQLDNNGDFSSPEIDTGKVQSSATQTTQTLPNAVGLYYWRVRVWDTRNLPSNYSSPRRIIVDRLEVYGAWVSDSRADVGSTQYCYWQLRYDYDDVVFDNTKGVVRVNGESASWNAQQSRWEYATTKSSVGSYTYTLSFVDNVYGLTAITGTTQLTIIFDRLEVFGYGVTDDRVNVGESVVVWVKIRYAYDGQVLDGSKGSVSIGGITASWNSANARWQISVSQSSVCKVDYQTPSSVNDSQYGLTVISGTVVQSVIWDRVLVASSGATSGRVNVGSQSIVYFVLRYEFDNALVNDGSVYVNGTLASYSPQNGRWELAVVQTTVCRRAYYVSAVSGNAYGITVVNHQAPYPAVIWDRVLVLSGGVAKSRANVGTSVKVYFVLRYAYDNALMTSGSVRINGTFAAYNATAGRWEVLVSQNVVGRFGYVVSSVLDGAYGLTLFQDLAGAQYCIWDRIQIFEGGVSDSRLNVGGTLYVWFKARYEYDNATFDGFKGSLLINGTAATWDGARWLITYSSNAVGRRAFTVSSVQDSQYGLTAFSMAVDPPYAVFDKVLVTLSAERTRINVGSQAPISFSAVYAYDGAAFRGYVRLNDTDVAKTSAGRWGFTVLAISDDLYGLTAFECNAISIVWDGLAVHAQSVDLERGVIAVRVKYAYDGLPVAGARVSYAGLTAFTNASGWAVFSVWNITRVSYGSAAYALYEPQYGLSVCTQSLAVQFAKEGADSVWVSAKAPISNFVWDVVNRKLSFHSSGTVVCFVDGLGKPQRVEVNRQTWTNWVYREADCTLVIYGLSSYVLVSWPLPPKPEQAQPPPQYISMVSLSVGSVDLGVVAPGQKVNFTIPISCNGSASIIGVEFLLKPEWFTLESRLPITTAKGAVSLAVVLSVPSNVQGKFSIPFKVSAVVEGTSISANGLVNFTVGAAQAPSLERQILAYMGDPMVIILILLTVLVVAAALRRR